LRSTLAFNEPFSSKEHPMHRISLPSLALAAIVSFSVANPALARIDGDLLVKPSSLTVKESIDALAKAVEAAGAKVVARVDHAAGAKATGAEMKPAEVLIFGNPKLGTPLMQANPRAGLDLPMKVLAYEDAKGKVWIVTTRAAALKSRYAIKGRDDVITAMTGALDKLTGAAAGSPAGYQGVTLQIPSEPAAKAPAKK
jgi:uncharacterized protein (DUF302 family)